MILEKRNHFTEGLFIEKCATARVFGARLNANAIIYALEGVVQQLRQITDVWFVPRIAAEAKRVRVTNQTPAAG